MTNRRLRFAEAVEEVVEEDAEGGVDEAGDEKALGEPGLRLSEQQFSNQENYALVQNEEGGSKSEAGGGMFGIEARADGGCQIADNCFGYPVETERGFTEAVLQKAGYGAEEKTGGRVAAAQSEIDRNKQRQIENARFGNVNGKKRLQDYGDQQTDQNRASTKL